MCRFRSVFLNQSSAGVHYTKSETGTELALLESICPDAFMYPRWLQEGNSGSGTFNAAGEMVGILISGATDFIPAVVASGSATGHADMSSYCMEFARCTFACTRY